MKKLRSGLFVLVAAILLSGGTCQPPIVAIEPSGTEFCDAACANLRRLGCPEGYPLEDGTTCERFCLNTQKSGHPLNPQCVSRIQSCGRLNDCTNH